MLLQGHRRPHRFTGRSQPPARNRHPKAKSTNATISKVARGRKTANKSSQRRPLANVPQRLGQREAKDWNKRGTKRKAPVRKVGQRRAAAAKPSAQKREETGSQENVQATSCLRSWGAASMGNQETSNITRLRTQKELFSEPLTHLHQAKLLKIGFFFSQMSQS